MPDRALGTPRRVGVFDEPAAGDGESDQRGKAEADDERGAHELMVEGGRVMSEEVADGAEGAGPDGGAGEVEEREAARVHRRDAGDERDEHSHNRHEAAEKHGARAMALEEAVGALERAGAAVGAPCEKARAAAAEIEGGHRTAEGVFAIRRLDYKIGEGEWADTDVVDNDVVVHVRIVLATPA